MKGVRGCKSVKSGVSSLGGSLRTKPVEIVDVRAASGKTEDLGRLMATGTLPDWVEINPDAPAETGFFFQRVQPFPAPKGHAPGMVFLYRRQWMPRLLKREFRAKWAAGWARRGGCLIRLSRPGAG